MSTLAFLIRGPSNPLSEPSDGLNRGYEVKIIDPSQPIDTAEMWQKVQKPLKERIALHRDGSYTIDGIFSIYRSNSEEWSQRATEMEVIAVGSGLLLPAILITGWHKKSLISLVTTIVLGLLFLLCWYRNGQATEQLTQAKNHGNTIANPDKAFAIERAVQYPKTAQDVLKKPTLSSDGSMVIPNPIFHPVEGEFFFRQFFKEWTDEILNPAIKTLEEKSHAVKSFLMSSSFFKTIDFETNAALFLVDASGHRSPLLSYLKPLIENYAKFQRRIFSSRDRIQKLQMVKRAAFRKPFLENPFVGEYFNTNHKTSENTHYADLALEAALPEHLKISFSELEALLLEYDAKIYEKIVGYVRNMVAFVNKTGPCPPAIDLDRITFPQMPDKVELLPLNDQWYERAKALQPQEGNLNDYHQFLGAIKSS